MCDLNESLALNKYLYLYLINTENDQNFKEHHCKA